MKGNQFSPHFTDREGKALANEGGTQDTSVTIPFPEEIEIESKETLDAAILHFPPESLGNQFIELSLSHL